jgi:hypothetical protein
MVALRQKNTQQQIHQQEKGIELVLQTGAAAASPFLFITVLAGLNNSKFQHGRATVLQAPLQLLNKLVYVWFRL